MSVKTTRMETEPVVETHLVDTAVSALPGGLSLIVIKVRQYPMLPFLTFRIFGIILSCEQFIKTFPPLQ